MLQTAWDALSGLPDIESENINSQHENDNLFNLGIELWKENMYKKCNFLAVYIRKYASSHNMKSVALIFLTQQFQ